jgi:tetratricopeptide (TPR) repeat protein
MPYTPMQLAEAFIQTGELQDAMDALNQQLQANPVDDEARRLRIQVLMRIQDRSEYQAALADLEQLKNPTARDLTNRYIILEHMGDYAGALEVAARLYQNDPTDERVAERYFWRATTQKEYTQAAQILTTMPRTSGWLTKAGDLAMENGQLEKAPQHYSEGLKQLGIEFDLSTSDFARPIHANLLMSRAQAYATLGQFHEASQDYAAAQVIMPNDPLIGFWHSFVLAELGHIQEAVVTCRIALETPIENLKARMVDNLRALADNPTFAPLAALLDTPTP